MKPRIGVTTAPDIHDRRPIDRVNREYADAVVRAGGLPLLLPTLDPSCAPDVVAELEGLLLTGGGDVAPERHHAEPRPEVYGVHPERDAWEMALVAAAGAGDVPILGVCRGAQLLNVAAGGTLVLHLPAITDQPHHVRDHDHEPAHTVSVEPGSTLAGIVGTELLGVNTLHHQAVAAVGEGLRPVAWAPDGVIEAVESADGRPVVGVQWHPEMLIHEPRHLQLFVWLARAAAARRPSLVHDLA